MCAHVRPRAYNRVIDGIVCVHLAVTPQKQMAKPKKLGYQSGKIYGDVYVSWWEDKVYPTRFWVLVVDGESIKPGLDVIYNITDEQPLTDYERATAMTLERFDPEGVQNIFLLYRKTSSINCVAHEVVHGVNFVFKHVGVKLDTDNDEHQAYMTGYLVENVMEQYINFDKLLNEKCQKPKRKARN